METSLPPGKRTPGPDAVLTWRHRLEYLLFLAFELLVRMLPGRLSRWIGSAFGWLAFALDARHRRTATINLQLVFGADLTPSAREDLARKCFIHFGQAIMETLRLNNLNGRNFLRKVTIEGSASLYQALAEGKGLLFCSAHYGNWELLAQVMGQLKLPLSVMARPMDNPLIHRAMERLRTASGNRVIYKHKSVRKVMADLKENRIVGVVNDQDVHDQNRIFAPFFGQTCTATPLPATLAWKLGTPLVCGFAEPQGKGRYLLRFSPLIRANQDAPQAEEVQRLTILLNQALEEQIRRAPAYWLWMHQRFKTTPHGWNEAYPTRSRRG
jgi:KDO2-lipid IV(A) lauroyltransferase